MLVTFFSITNKLIQVTNKIADCFSIGSLICLACHVSRAISFYLQIDLANSIRSQSLQISLNLTMANDSLHHTKIILSILFFIFF